MNCFRSLYLWVDLQRHIHGDQLVWVVNCFRSLYLWVDLQLWAGWGRPVGCCELLSFFVPLGWFTAPEHCYSEPACCELLSFFVPLGWFTAAMRLWRPRARLWIAFVLCTFGLIYSWLGRPESLLTVVNCFRSLYLWVDLQPSWHNRASTGGCELLSFFVPLGWFTAGPTVWPSCQRLWIAFVLCTFGLIYSVDDTHDYYYSVVNCFRSLYLWVDLQFHVRYWLYLVSCELLSFFVPLGWFTASLPCHPCLSALWIAFVLCTFGLIYSHKISTERYSMLWIAFVLCTFGLIYSVQLRRKDQIRVVNCFRSLYLWVDLQHDFMAIDNALCCELLSFFVPLGWFTAGVVLARLDALLWIAFVLCTFGLIYSFRTELEYVKLVVNCFRSLYLWVDLQQFRLLFSSFRRCELLSFFVPLGWFTAKARQWQEDY